MENTKGLFITLEGGEGTGKTTLALTLKKKLEEMGYEVVLTREPGGVKTAEEIRSVILSPSSENMDATTEAFLFAAARREHLVQKVLPALESGKVVICDRFIHSSLVYQGIVGELGAQRVMDLNSHAIEGKLPDLTLYLDIASEVGIARIMANAGREVNSFDKKPLEFHKKVRDGYLSIPTLFPEHEFRMIDASGTPEMVSEKALLHVMSLLQEVNAQ